MSLVLPDKLEHYWHDDIVRTLMKLNPRFHMPNRGSWLQGVPDLEDVHREVIEVALTDLRNSWGQCLYYYRMNATRIYLVLSPKLYLDYQTKEKGFIKINPIPNVEVYTLPELPIKGYLLPKNSKKPIHVPELKFIITEEDKQKAIEKNSAKEQKIVEHKAELQSFNLTEDTVTDDDFIITNAVTEMVTVLTPLDHKALISKEAYEKEKDGENFWRPLK